MKLIFDIETDGLYEDCTRCWVICTKDIVGGAVKRFYDIPLGQGGRDYTGDRAGSVLDGVDYLNQAEQLIGHNVIEFDIPVLQKLFGFEPRDGCQITDTLVLSRLFQPDRPGGHSLAAWGQRLGFPKGDHDDWSCLSPGMLTYCEQDVAVNAKLYQALKDEIKGQRWGESIQLEHDVAHIISQQQVNGVYFDHGLAHKTIGDLKQTVSEVDTGLSKRLPTRLQPVGAAVTKPFKKDGTLSARAVKLSGSSGDGHITVAGPFQAVSFNRTDLGSDKQVKEWLLSIGWEPTEFTPTGGPKLTEDSFDSLPDKEIGTAISARVQARHRMGQIQGWLDNLRDDNRITAGANTIGTPTGRMRHRTVVNVPAAATYPKDHDKAGELHWASDTGLKQSVYMGTEMRSMFCVPNDDYVIVGHDASGLELRMLAHYMNDPEYTEILLNGDIHSHNQELAGLHARSAAKTFI